MFKFDFTLASVLLVLIAAKAQGKVFEKCELAREMSRLGVPRSELPDWICLAEGESTFNTEATHYNSDNSMDWGIFQINDRYWCHPWDNRGTANICGISCNELLQDDIAKAVDCARVVKNEQSWGAWVAWTNNCQYNKPSVNECF